MKAYKCLYVRFIVILLAVTVAKTVPRNYDSDDSIDQLITTQLLKDFDKPRSVKRGSFTEPPQYMLDLYNEVADSSGLSTSPLPHGASLVRAIPVQVFDKTEFTFSLEGIPAEETILEGEVHIHLHQLNSDQRKLLGSQNLFNVNLFIKNDKGETLLSESQTVGSHFSGWRMFNVGTAVKEARWKEGRITFLVETKSLDGESIDSTFHHGHHSSTNPILVLFADSEDSDSPFSFQELAARNAYSEYSKSRRVSRSVKSIPEPFEIKQNKGCVLQHLTVTFDEIGWGWVMYPREYDAFNCAGICSFPLSQDYNPTNHATIISIVHHNANPSKPVSNPCCVPTSYAKLSLLYIDDVDTVILKQFDNMIAKECACR